MKKIELDAEEHVVLSMSLSLRVEYCQKQIDKNEKTSIKYWKGQQKKVLGLLKKTS